MGEIIAILVLALIFLGPKKLPELASGLGKMIREVRKATADIKNEIQLDEFIRKPLEELREATMLAPEELKRRDEDRKQRAIWDKEEKERMEREVKEAATNPTAAHAAGTGELGSDTDSEFHDNHDGADGEEIPPSPDPDVTPSPMVLSATSATALNSDRTIAMERPPAFDPMLPPPSGTLMAAVPAPIVDRPSGAVPPPIPAAAADRPSGPVRIAGTVPRPAAPNATIFGMPAALIPGSVAAGASGSTTAPPPLPGGVKLPPSVTRPGPPPPTPVKKA